MIYLATPVPVLLQLSLEVGRWLYHVEIRSVSVLVFDPPKYPKWGAPVWNDLVVRTVVLNKQMGTLAAWNPLSIKPLASPARPTVWCADRSPTWVFTWPAKCETSNQGGKENTLKYVQTVSEQFQTTSDHFESNFKQSAKCDSCPLCIFQYTYTSSKRDLDQRLHQIYLPFIII